MKQFSIVHSNKIFTIQTLYKVFKMRSFILCKPQSRLRSTVIYTKQSSVSMRAANPVLGTESFKIFLFISALEQQNTGCPI